MFYLSPCNSFYILGLCSLASVQSQPRDTGLYQAHMCALLQLTHISSFVTVTKLARLSWEMCRLWLTAHVWILYFESHADLSNMGSVKASLTLLSRTGAMESCRGFTALTTCFLIALLSVYLCECVLLLPKLSLGCMLLACSFISSAAKILRGKKNKQNIFHACVLARLPVREKRETCVPWSDQSLKLHQESFSNNSLILGLQRSVDVCCLQRKSVKSVPCDANSLKYCFHNCAS